MVKKSMNPALIAVVVVLLVLIGFVLYTNSKEDYTSFWEHVPVRGEEYDIQCRVDPEGALLPGNSFKCLPKNSMGETIWQRTSQLVSNKMNRGLSAHLFNIQDRNNSCNGGAHICTSEGAFVDQQLRNMRSRRGPRTRAQVPGPRAGPRAGPRGRPNPGPRTRALVQAQQRQRRPSDYYCNLPNSRYFCLPRNNVGRRIYNMIRSRAAQKNGFLYRVNDANRACNGRLRICTNEGAYAAYLLRRFRVRQ